MPPVSERPARASQIAQPDLFERDDTRDNTDGDPEARLEEPPALAIARHSAHDSSEVSRELATRAPVERAAHPDHEPAPPSAAEHAGEHDHHDHLLTHFFSSPPPEPSGALDEPYHVPMTIGSRRAMWSAVTIFAVSLVGIAGFTVYNQWLMPTPVELGSGISADPVTASAALAAPAPQPMIASVSSPAVEVPHHQTMHAAAPPPTAAPTAVADTTTAKSAMTLAVTAAVAAQPTAKPIAVAEQQAAPTPVTVPSFDELVDVGRSFAHRNRNEQAMKAFQQALALQPNAAPALAGMAYVQLNTGDKALAKSFAMRALDSDPTSSQAWIVLGAAQEQLGERAAARASYRKCASDAVGSYVLECKQLAH